MMAHQTVEMGLKYVRIDKGIAPVVEWLNEFESIITLNSCEGSHRKGSQNRPYIQFISMDSIRLMHILRCMKGMAEFEVDFDEDRAMLTYIARFYDKKMLEQAVEMVS